MRNSPPDTCSSQDDTSVEARVRAEMKLSEIGKNVWDRCANPGWQLSESGDISLDGSLDAPPPYNPFVAYDFLETLEATHCAIARTGWLGQHLVLEGNNGSVHGVVPAYLKNHSQGEYVFDYGWADAFERAGGQYYPKIQISVPFSPVTAPKLLSRPDENYEQNQRLLAAAVAELTRTHGASSAHLTFLPKDQWSLLGEMGFLRRTDQQFHWLNEGYQTFDDFLNALSSRKRKNIKKERREAIANDISIEWVTGQDLTEDHWDAFYGFYMDTGARKWGTPYLNRSFFSELGARMAGRILLILAKREDRYIAGAINMIGSDTLYGRNWGCIEDHPFLHFEVCYYQAIEFAIEHGLKRVEAGAQGAHKLARGYLPQTVYSAHFVAHEGFRRAIADYLEHERAQVELDSAYLAERAPFKRSQ